MFIFAACLFSIAGLFAAFKLHDRFDPARYFLLFWGGQILLSFLVFHHLFQFTGYGLAYISINCLIFSTGSLTGQYFGNTLPQETSKHSLKENRALILLKISIVLAFINVYTGIRAAGFNISEIFTLSTLIKLNVVAAENRYTGVEHINFATQLTLIFVYLAPLFGGYLLPQVAGKKRFWCVISVLPAMLISITQAIKLGFVTSIILFVVGIIVSSLANNAKFLKVGIRMWVKVSAGAIIILSVLLLSMIFRTGNLDKESAKYIGETFITYAFGHLPAFDAWFSHHIGQIEPSWGSKTFYGITNYLGIAERKQGVFTEFVYFGKNNFREIPPGYETNVYSLFRFILEDFGFFGSMVIIYLTGFFSGFSWMMIRRVQFSFVAQAGLIAMLFFVLMSFATSVWAYTSYIATMAMAYILISLSFGKTQNKPIHA